MEPLWRVRLFDGPTLENTEGSAVQRFRSQRVGALLAYLALHLNRACPREELAENLWPEEEAEVTANRLRVTLSSLRKQLEPPGTPFGSVLDVAQARRVRLRSDAVWCDAIAFEQALKSGETEKAAQLARGPLLPDYYDDWAIAARERFQTLTENLPTAPMQPLPETAEPVESVAHRLPRYLTRFFGREAEIQRLVEILETAYLISVIGPGGMGKTRLVVEAARTQRLPAVFVALADLTDHLPVAILNALGAVARADRNPTEQLVAILSRTPTLLILDNAEHLIEAVAELALRLLDAVPNLRLIVTSRQSLEVSGEVLLSLSPLEPPSVPASPERLTEFPAVALFVDRARNSLPDFVLAPRHTEALVEICQRLEGIPLALELAAARVTVQTPAQIAESLARNLMGLKSRQRGLSERHRSLRAAIQGSFDLLTPELRSFFARLSVFRGGWTAEAAAAVTGRADAETLLEELVMRSLVVVREDTRQDRMRYGFLEMLRQFAEEALLGADYDICVPRHTTYFLTLAAQSLGHDLRTLLPLDGESENLMMALEQGWNNKNEAFWRGVTGVLNHGFIRGLHPSMRIWVERALAELPSISDYSIRFWIRSIANRLLIDMGHFEEAHHVTEAMQDDAERHNDSVAAVYAATYSGYLASETGEFERSVRIHKEALARAQELSDPYLLQRCQFLTARSLTVHAASVPQPPELAQATCRESEMLLRALVAESPAYSPFGSLGMLGLAVSLLGQNRREEAYSYLKRAQRAAWEMREQSVLMYTFLYESRCIAGQNHTEGAVILLGAFLNLQERMGYVAANAPTEVHANSLREKLGAQAFDSLLRRGRQTPAEELVTDSIPETSSAHRLPH